MKSWILHWKYVGENINKRHNHLSVSESEAVTHLSLKASETMSLSVMRTVSGNRDAVPMGENSERLQTSLCFSIASPQQRLQPLQVPLPVCNLIEDGLYRSVDNTDTQSSSHSFTSFALFISWPTFTLLSLPLCLECYVITAHNLTPEERGPTL